MLLNEGVRRNFDGHCLARENVKRIFRIQIGCPVSEAIMKLIPGLSCDIPSLLTRAKTIEQDLRKVKAGQNNSAINLHR